MKFLIVLLLLFMAYISNTCGETTSPTLLENWDAGFKRNLKLQLLDNVIGGWKINLKFSKPVHNLQIWKADVVSQSADEYELENKPWNANLAKCDFLEMDFLLAKNINGESAATALVTFTRKSGSGGSDDPNACIPTTAAATTGAPTTANPVQTTNDATTTVVTTQPPVPTTANPAPTTDAATNPPAVGGEIVSATRNSEWNEAFNMRFKIQIQSPVNDGWKIMITFSIPVDRIDIWRASFVSKSADGLVFEVENMSWNTNLNKCAYLEMSFNAYKVQQVQSNPTATVTFIRKQPGSGESATISGNSCNSNTAAPPTDAPTTSVPNPTTAVATTPPPSNAPTTENPAPTTQEATTTVGTTLPPTDNPTTENPAPTTQEAITTISTTQPPTDAPTTENPAPTTHEATTVQPVTTSEPVAGPYDYDEVLRKSILFYEAQRSGDLPDSNRVLWRKDSALGDSGDNGEDLTGGWYDAGDYVKFGFPMASSVTVLAWGLVEYRDAYQAAGELDAMLDCIKWPLDYFIKAHTADLEFYGQVGDGHTDHASWGRPEDMTMARPAFKISTSKPGSDLAAETAAAMAAASIAFNQTDPSYASTLLQHAKKLYEFADQYRGKYSDAITNAGSFYNSWSGYNDELVWGVAWLYRATNNPGYLAKAEQYYQDFGMGSRPEEFSWDDKKAGAQLLLAKATGKGNYKDDVMAFLDRWLPGGGLAYTPKGLAWLRQWGPNRYSANTAFLAVLAADLGLNPSSYRDFAKKQIHYMLGDGGRSYVVGFGNNPPQRPHHRSSSCPDAPAQCTWNEYNIDGPNPQVLYGALVGGPGNNDEYADDRKDFIKNEVATDYNAGFQSAVAGLKHLEINP